MYYFLVSDFFVFVSWILHQVNYNYHISRLNRQKKQHNQRKTSCFKILFFNSVAF